MTLPENLPTTIFSVKLMHLCTLFQDKNGFIEEAVVRSELSDNFCFYNPNYDSIEGGSDWARKTLQDHAKDKREYVYTEKVKCPDTLDITA